MNTETLIHHIIHDPQHFDAYAKLLKSWPENEVLAEVEAHKQTADEHWYKDPNVSLEHANIIIGIGMIREDDGIKALGMMARGDAIKFMGRTEEAWMTLEQAAELYLLVDDQIGWSRTWIGRLFASAELGCVEQAIRESRRARDILVVHQEYARCLSLDLNAAYASYSTGNYKKTLDVCFAALSLAEELEDIGKSFLGRFYTNIGCAYTELGELQQANTYFQYAHDEAVDNPSMVLALVNAKENMANIALMQGHYRRALALLLEVDQLINQDQHPTEFLTNQRFLIECYLALNRYSEVSDLALKAIAELRTRGFKQELGYTLRHLAIAQAHMGHFEEALTILDEAKAILTFVGDAPWVADVRLKRGQLMLRNGNAHTALQEAQTAYESAVGHGKQVSMANALLLQGQVAFAFTNYSEASRYAKQALRIAQKHNVPWLRYSSHLLLARIESQQKRFSQAVRRYNVAAHTVERVQRDLTITLRPDFLENKEDALKGLIGLYLENDQSERAFQALERSKSQTFFNHISNRDNLRWTSQDPYSQMLIEKLELLRGEHQTHYRLVYQSDLKSDKTVTDVQQGKAREALLNCERQMKEITEKLYLHNNHNSVNFAQLPSLEAIQDQLPENGLLIEFYVDAGRIWVFTLTKQAIQIYPLAATLGSIESLISKLQFEIKCALTMGTYKGARAIETSRLTLPTQLLLKQFYKNLLKPFEDALASADQIIIVPYGILHYLPFHLLHNGENYLIEKHDVYVLPAAGMVTAYVPKREPSALILGDTWNGHLPQALDEAKMAYQMLGGSFFGNDEITRHVLQATPGKVLHIAAHGEYRPDRPDLSYIYLGGNQIFADDLFQQDLSYELVTLSACETGRAKPVSGDELIGLSRGFLYAGAGALVGSMWRVADSLTIGLMEHFYRALRQGDSKVAALRTAQLSLLAEAPELHPAFWGAFQLWGNPDPIF